MKGATPQIEIRIASRLEEIDLVAMVAEAFLEHLGYRDRALERAALAVREATANAVEHGHALAADKPVWARFVVEGDWLRVEIGDEGEGFEPAKVPDPLAPENLLKPRGRGIFLMRKGMDEVVYEFGRPAGTRVTMKKRLPGEGPAVSEPAATQGGPSDG